MKARWVREVRELLRSPEFLGWYQRYNELSQGVHNAKARRDDLLAQVNMVRFRADLTQQLADDLLFAAGEFEDRSARAHAEFAEIENTSFEVLSAFELERQRATDTWVEMDRAEKRLEDERQRASELRRLIEAARKSGNPEGLAEVSRLEARLKELEIAIDAFAAEAQASRGRRQQVEERKERLWQEVEAAWSSAFHANMARTEYSYQARRQRSEAEELFARATAQRRRVAQLEEEAEHMIQRISGIQGDFDALLLEGRHRFDCTLIREFVFWPHKGDVRSALCVPLIDEADHFNIQIFALQVYKVERGRGLGFIEPVAEGEEQMDEEDPRLDAFFHEGRST